MLLCIHGVSCCSLVNLRLFCAYTCPLKTFNRNCRHFSLKQHAYKPIDQTGDEYGPLWPALPGNLGEEHGSGA
jgi:hypothetical protein